MRELPLVLRKFPSLLCVPILLVLSGCSQAFNATGGEGVAGTAVQGKLYGGEQPLVGAAVYLYAASTSGYNTQATSLLTSSVPSVCGSGSSACKDGNNNYYAVTGANGAFSITGDWSCTAGTYVYLLAVGGNPGGGKNPNSYLMAALGNCSNVTSSTYVTINEVTTAASAWALSGFMSSPTQLSSASSAASQAGLAAAFATYGNLVNNATGAGYTTTPGSGTVTGTVSTANLYTLADILAACVNSTGGTNNDGSTCGSLFFYSTPSGGTAATNTLQAALNIVHNPAVDSAGNLYAIIGSSPPFNPYLSSAPYDWTLPIVFSGGGMSNLYDIAIDGNNNVWAISDGTNGNCAELSASTGSNVVELSNLGVAKSGSNGYTNTNLACPFAIAIDTSNQAWVVNDYVAYLNKISTTGTVTALSNSTNLSYGDGLAFDANGYLFITNYTQSYVSSYLPSGGTWTKYTGAGVTASSGGVSWGIAADANGHVFIASDTASGRVDAFTDSSGTLSALTTSSGYTGAGITYPLRLAVDQGSNVWVANFGSDPVSAPGSTLSKFSVSGSTFTAASGSPFSGGGLYAPFGIAVDGGNNIWVADAAAYGVSEFDNSGNAISPLYGFIGTIASPTTAAMYFPEAVAIDESGNVWVANYGVNDSSSSTATVQATITELVGAAIPTLTPISAATAAKTPAAKP